MEVLVRLTVNSYQTQPKEQELMGRSGWTPGVSSCSETDWQHPREGMSWPRMLSASLKGRVQMYFHTCQKTAVRLLHL